MTGFSNLLAQLGPWGWFIIAAVLMMLETVLPGVYLLWFGLAAALVGLVTLVTDASWPGQLLLFAGLAAVTVLIVRRFAAPNLAGSDVPDLNDRGRQYLGRLATVEDAITGGRGKVRIGDTLWPVTGPDMDRGAQVRIIGSDGAVLTVEPA